MSMTMSASDPLFAQTFIAWKEFVGLSSRKNPFTFTTWPWHQNTAVQILIAARHLLQQFRHLLRPFKPANHSAQFMIQTFLAAFPSDQNQSANSVSDIYCSGWHLLPFCFEFQTFCQPTQCSRSASFLNPDCFSHPKDGNPPTSSVKRSVPQIFQPRTNQKSFPEKILKAPPLRNLGNIFRNFWIKSVPTYLSNPGMGLWGYIFFELLEIWGLKNHQISIPLGGNIKYPQRPIPSCVY